MSNRLTKKILAQGVSELCQQDPDLAAVIKQYGSPPLWLRKTGFSTLVLLILEQQVSLASAQAINRKLQQYYGEITAESISSTTERKLRSLGVTRQKSRYIRDLAVLIDNRSLNLVKIHRADDANALDELVKIRGIGPWTADIYLLCAMGRPDVWPRGDLALAESMRKLKGLRNRPDIDKQLRIARDWGPWRSIAARILWHNYLSERAKK